MRTLVLAVALVLAAPAGAGGPFERIVGVGAGGRSVAIRLAPTGPLSDASLDGAPVASPRGGYVRVFPLIGALPGIPGRLFPAAHVLCWSWSWLTPSCVRLGLPGRRLLAPLARLPLLREPPTVAVRVRFHGHAIAGQANVAVALELALDRRPACCPRAPSAAVPLDIAWRGPAARPPRVALAPRGVYARGRLYPAPAGLWCYVALNLPVRWPLPEPGEAPLPPCG